MITDAQLRPSNAQAITTGTQVSTNSIDLISKNANMGRGMQRRFVIKIVTAFVGGTSVQASMVQSNNADLSGGTVLATGPVVAEANATIGTTLLDVVIPDTTAQYIGASYTSVGTHTAGAVFAGEVADTDRQPYLPANTGL
mgnify:CR=1 FL=1